MNVFLELNGETKEGLLSCGCGHLFPIIEYIPRMLTDSIHELPRFIEKHFIATGRTRRAKPALDKHEEKTREGFDLQWSRAGRVFLDEKIYGNTGLFCKATGTTEKEAAEYFHGKFMLDAGCGVGRYSTVAVRFGADVVALDFSSQAVLQAQKVIGSFDGCHVVQGNILKLPFRPESFDVVFSVGVIHHTKDLRKAFRNLTNVLKVDGRMILGVYPYFQKSIFIKMLRKITTRIPHRILFYLCFLAIPLSYIPKLRSLCYPWASPKDHWKKKIVETYDHHHPYFQDYYTREGIRDWFNELGCYKQITRTEGFDTFLSIKSRRIK